LQQLGPFWKEKENMMLQVTQGAADHLTGMLVNTNAPKEAAIRIKQEANELKLYTDMPKTDDVAFEHQGRTVLILDQQISNVLNNRILDVASTPQGQTLTLKS
jgi:Fe-S cluster assembly iron-binding protein IscA